MSNTRVQNFLRRRDQMWRNGFTICDDAEVGLRSYENLIRDENVFTALANNLVLACTYMRNYPNNPRLSSNAMAFLQSSERAVGQYLLGNSPASQTIENLTLIRQGFFNVIERTNVLPPSPVGSMRTSSSRSSYTNLPSSRSSSRKSSTGMLF